MFFNTWPFALFAAVVVLVFGLAPARLRPFVLIVAGLAFYASAGPASLLLVVAAVLGTYAAARAAQRRNAVGALAAAGGVVALLAVLAYCKYARWLSGAAAWGLPGLHLSIVGPLVAPLAISFFTFEFVHYIVEVRAGRIADVSLKRFLLFALFFPTMIAGPIKRYGSFAPQADALHLARGAKLNAALYRIFAGLFKKIAIADSVSLFTQPIFHPDPSYGALTYALALVAGSALVYYDLAGYTDMAIGFGALFGVGVPENFARPYAATNVLDFWSRWHISLTSWLRDYLYFPLARRLRGSRERRRAGVRSSAIVCTFIVMLVVGIWHGAGVHFLVWGVWNGICVAVYQLWHTRVVRRVALLRRPSLALALGSRALTYASFTFGLGWIAAPSTPAALMIYRAFI